MTVQRWGFRELVKLMIQDLFDNYLVVKNHQRSTERKIAQRSFSIKSTHNFFSHSSEAFIGLTS